MKRAKPARSEKSGVKADEVIGIFPTPVMLCRKAVPDQLVKALIEQFEAAGTGPNVRTTKLTHTPMADPRTHDNFVAVYRTVLPKLKAYGETLMGEQLDWAIKEIWINKMERDGAQKMHNHANSFISGIIYLSSTADSVSTVFHRHVGSTSFVMDNANERCKISSYNSPIYSTPPTEAGDLLLFPSYLMHEVPPNQGAQRYTAAFNALPERIDSWGYLLRFK